MQEEIKRMLKLWNSCYKLKHNRLSCLLLSGEKIKIQRNTIMLAVLCRHATWRFTFICDDVLRVFDKSVLREIMGDTLCPATFPSVRAVTNFVTAVQMVQKMRILWPEYGCEYFETFKHIMPYLIRHESELIAKNAIRQLFDDVISLRRRNSVSKMTAAVVWLITKADWKLPFIF